MTEAPILRDVLVAVTALPGSLFFRANSGLFLTLDGKRHVKANVPGCGDILGAYRGKPVAIETKAAVGEQRKTQKRFQAAWEKAGGVYILARSAADALTVLGAIR